MLDTPESALAEAIRLCGSRTALAERVGVTRMAVSQWKIVPPLRVLDVERAVAGQVTRYELRPDIYPREGQAA